MNELIDSFSNRLSKALSTRNMKPIELSEKSGISRGKISSYINGKYKANQNALYSLATALNVNPVWLMGYDVPMDSTIPIKNNITNRIKLLREENSFTQLDLATRLNCSKSVIGLYESETRKPSMEVLIKLSEIFNCSIDYILGKSDIRNTNINNSKQFYMCPVYGKISAGTPNWAEECLEGYLPIDPNMFGIINPEECFFLKVDGESMNKEIKNGAYALIRKQDIVEDGEICAVLVNGYEATLKRFSKQGDFIVLEPSSTDASFKMQIYDKNTTIKILGKMIGKFEINK